VLRSFFILQVARILSDTVGQSRAKVMDLCCGVGISTRALHDAFPDAEKVVGLDTSPQMIAMASFLDWHVRFFRPLVALVSDQVSTAVTTVSTYFERGNAERTKHEDRSFDLVTIMYAFHEVPKEGRDRILAEAHRYVRHMLVLSSLRTLFHVPHQRFLLSHKALATGWDSLCLGYLTGLHPISQYDSWRALRP
jgi:ubiquinone/menaquinone biosynthesis C-methylase UbiE